MVTSERLHSRQSRLTGFLQLPLEGNEVALAVQELDGPSVGVVQRPGHDGTAAAGAAHVHGTLPARQVLDVARAVAVLVTLTVLGRKWLRTRSNSKE